LPEVLKPLKIFLTLAYPLPMKITHTMQ